MNPVDFKNAYDRDGFVFLPGLLSDTQISQVRDAVDAAMMGAKPGDAGFDFEAALVDGSPVVQRIKKPHEMIPACRELAGSAVLLDYVEALIGPDIRLHHSKINVKAPRVGAPLEWHQDWAFVPHTNQSLVFISVFIDDVPAEKGPLQLIPGSHKQGLRDHHEDGVFYGAIDPDTLAPEKAVSLVGPRGSVSFHHPLAVHGSGHNRSTESRRMMFFEMAAADAWPLTYGVQWAEFESRLLRGKRCVTPRLENVEVKVPYPAPAGGSAKIYEQQQLFKKRYFTA